MHTKRMSEMQSHLDMRQKQLKAKTPAAEQMVDDALLGVGVKFQRQKGYLCKFTSIRIVDFFVRNPYRLIVEVDGPEHTQTEDFKKESQIAKTTRRHYIYRISNEEVFSIGDGLQAHFREILQTHLNWLRNEKFPNPYSRRLADLDFFDADKISGNANDCDPKVDRAVQNRKPRRDSGQRTLTIKTGETTRFGIHSDPEHGLVPFSTRMTRKASLT